MHWRIDPINDPLAEELAQDEGLDLSACSQVAACSAVCPIADSFDYLPHQMVRQVQLNERKRVMRSSAIWLCTDCGACTAACPEGIDVARMMAQLRRRSYRDRQDPAVDAEGVRASHEALLEELEGHGRPADARVALSYKMRAMDVFTDFTVGLSLWRAGQVSLAMNTGGAGGPRAMDLAHDREIAARDGHDERAYWYRQDAEERAKAAAAAEKKAKAEAEAKGDGAAPGAPPPEAAALIAATAPEALGSEAKLAQGTSEDERSGHAAAGDATEKK